MFYFIYNSFTKNYL